MRTRKNYSAVFAGRFIRVIRKLLMENVFERIKSTWTDELTSKLQKHNNTIRNPPKMTPTNANSNLTQNDVYYILEVKRTE